MTEPSLPDYDRNFTSPPNFKICHTSLGNLRWNGVFVSKFVLEIWVTFVGTKYSQVSLTSKCPRNVVLTCRGSSGEESVCNDERFTT